MNKFDKKKNDAKIVKAPKPKVYGDERDFLLAEKGKVNCTMPPRTRPGKTYPGGRRMRRALARLDISRKMTELCRQAAGKGGKQSKSDAALQMPGAMNP